MDQYIGKMLDNRYELLELIGMSDRMMIFKDGKVSKEFARSADLKENDIIEYII